MISLSRDGRQILVCMLCQNNSSAFFVWTVLNPGCPPAHSKGRTGSSLVPTIYGACGTICNMMMSIVPTLFVAVVTPITIISSACPPATGGGLGCGAVSRFMCVHCTSTGPAVACFSLRRQSAATSVLHNLVARQALAFWRYMLKPWPSTSWPELVARRGLRQTFDTSHQVTQSVVSEKKRLTQSRLSY